MPTGAYNSASLIAYSIQSYIRHPHLFEKKKWSGKPLKCHIQHKTCLSYQLQLIQSLLMAKCYNNKEEKDWCLTTPHPVITLSTPSPPTRSVSCFRCIMRSNAIKNKRSRAMDRRIDGWMDRQTDRQTDEGMDPLIEMQGRIKKIIQWGWVTYDWSFWDHIPLNDSLNF